MDRADVLRVYDERDFAEAYDERFVLAPWPKHGADIELDMLRELIGDDGRWVDLCCGTGWYLSQFPDVDRAGLDLTPAMLEQARAANPGVPFVNQDVCDPVEEWVGQWDVVSLMWMAYCYLESMPEVERAIANLVSYVREGGSAFIPSVIDLEDLRPHTLIDYEDFPEVWGGRIAVTGYNWTWEEPNGNVNANMMAVHVGHFVRLIEPYFERVEVRRYPLFGPGMVARKAVIGIGKRPAGETGAAEIVWDPIPEDPTRLTPEEQRLALLAELEAADAAARRAEEARKATEDAEQAAWAENETRWADNAAEWAKHNELAQAEIARANAAEAEVGRLAGEVDRLRAEVARLEGAPAPAPARPSRTQLSKVPTKDLARAIGGRVRPDRLLRRVKRRRS